MKVSKWIAIFLLCATVCFALSISLVQAEQQAISSKLIRFHVVANSDSKEDQQMKLRVRDEILRYLSENDDWRNRQETIEWISTHLDNIAAVGAQTLANDNVNHKVTVKLCFESYPQRQYDTFALPAGDYTSLRVEIGEGAGKNWWCVVYPAICMTKNQADFTEEAACAGMTFKEVKLITSNEEHVKIKFKLLEWIEDLRKK